MAASDSYDPWFDEITLRVAQDATEGQGQAANKVVIKSADGSTVDVDSLEIPEGLKNLLKVIDADGGGVVDDTNVRDAMKMFTTMKAMFGTHGRMSHIEAEKGLSLLKTLVSEKAANSKEVSYTHMPDCVQDVMKEWDLDRSGSVSVLELSAAANAHKKVKQEGRVMRRIILALSGVILLLLTGTFILSYMAVDLAKEMRGSSDGVMKNNNGEVIKTDSSSFEVHGDGTLVTRGGGNASCPANSTCRGGAPVLQVAQAKPGKQLASTLPDSVFKNLDMVTLSDEPHFLQLKIMSMKRVQLRSSKCGSVVELHTQEGVLTIDDTALEADARLADYLEQAGMLHLLGSGGLFGRRLQQGFLEGFFTMLEDMEWECTSAPLPNPEDLPLNYRAKLQVFESVSATQLSDAIAGALSHIFPGIENPRPGFRFDKTSGWPYLTWTEDVLVFPNLRVAAKSFASHPFQTQLDITKAGARAFVDQYKGVGHHCNLGYGPVAQSLGKLVSQATNFRLVGLKPEGGRMLRQWRMDVSGSMNDTASQVMTSWKYLGKIILDYYDVDTDPTGVFEPGYPYRISAYKDPMEDTSGNFNITVQYQSITPVNEMNLRGALEFFNVTEISSPCSLDPLQSGTADDDLKQEIDALGVVSVAKVPRIDPWEESPGVVKWVADKLSTEGLNGHAASHYWNTMAFHAPSRKKLADSFNAVIVGGDTIVQFDSESAGGLNITLEVQYSNSSSSLPGGFLSIKATAVGTVSAPEAGASMNDVDLEVEISESSRMGGFAKSCATKEGTVTIPLSGLEFTIVAVVCLAEKFDHVLFTMMFASKPDETGAAFTVATISKKLGVMDAPQSTRKLCEESCSEFAEPTASVQSR